MSERQRANPEQRASSSQRAPLTVTEVRRTGPLVDAVYTDILQPSFPPAELVSLAALRDAITARRATLTVALDATGEPWGAAVGEWYESARVMLLGYLAARPGSRGHGVGGRLLEQAIRTWSERYRPCVVLAEVERPDRHRASLAHGDPTGRLRFYQRYGASALDLPYFQPALRADEDREYGMLLIALHVEQQYRREERAIDAEPVRRFWLDHLGATEGAPADSAARRMAAALAAEQVAVRPLDQYRNIAVAAG
ncbi:GNAT family N-acetyltransferase [Actinocatenispora sera]|uniref:N-acetyltransferase domain-containing protein n=1 Tax=Actinocatenispora sera TaxID=390989 RepID=A0A810L2K1_9ACTN|nr:GNAT family N-acetyltransferase [Actinocatenispora sera]BCJ28398.1 hypothetical protein Asera_25060 [Actinocatenispora sera]